MPKRSPATAPAEGLTDEQLVELAAAYRADRAFAKEAEEAARAKAAELLDELERRGVTTVEVGDLRCTRKARTTRSVADVAEALKLLPAGVRNLVRTVGIDLKLLDECAGAGKVPVGVIDQIVTTSTGSPYIDVTLLKR